MTLPVLRRVYFSSRRSRRVWQRFRSAVAATAIAFACLGGGASAALADGLTPYQVQAGDTVLGLANRFGVTPENIVSTNQMADPDVLAIGQTLQISLPNVPPIPLVHHAVDKHDEGPAADAGTTATADSTAAAAAQSASLLKVMATPPATKVVAVAPAPPPKPAIMSTTYYSQFDGSIWGATNCGPTSLAMGLGALNISADQLTLRNLANRQMGFASPDNGTTWESLAYAAKSSGAATENLYNGKAYRTWTFDDLKSELAKRHPVILLVRYWDLPDHADSAYAGDHYVVALGIDENGNVVYDDPAFKTTPGSDRTMDQAQLSKAWTNTSVGLARTAMALTQ